MDMRGLKFIEGDAFEYIPQKNVDWLICDVANFPEKYYPFPSPVWIPPFLSFIFLFFFIFKIYSSTPSPLSPFPPLPF
jgi:hypothetical protein